MDIVISIWFYLCILIPILILWLLIDRLFVHRHDVFLDRVLKWLLCIVILAPVLLLTVTLISSWRHASLYDRVTVGEFWDHSKQPDASSKYGDYTILYFFGKAFGGGTHEVPWKSHP